MFSLLVRDLEPGSFELIVDRSWPWTLKGHDQLTINQEASSVTFLLDG
jgi:hypothetical protein